MERYGDNRYGLDSQSLWFELEAAVPAILLKDYEDARATVDFFVSSIAHLALLGVSSVAIGVVRSAPGPLLVGMVSLLLTPVAYEGALRNMGEWRDVVQAMVNTGRLSLAGALGLSMPDRFSDEIAMWSRFTEFVNTGDTKLLPLLDRYRYKWRRPARQTAGNTPPSGPLEEDSNGSP
jgi:hypothetical protein